ncbi:hypothetical protein [Coprobacillus cateniformis]|uniref:hypothetical protein n=1 Tax=Coprobacillus cateniformis TaxID=100884 RepID=UPI0039A1AF4B
MKPKLKLKKLIIDSVCVAVALVAIFVAYLYFTASSIHFSQVMRLRLIQLLIIQILSKLLMVAIQLM